MKKITLDFFLFINKFFPKKTHPFDELKNGVSDMNYTDFEYNHAQWLLNQYKDFIDWEELKGKKILEIGSGWGWKIIYIAEKFQAHCVWIDLNQHFLQQAQNKSKELSIENQVEFLEMDALNMTFWNEEFDIVLMSDVLEHIPHTDKLLQEVLRVTKKDGKVLFDFAPYWHYYGHHIWDTIYIPWLHLFTTDNFRADLYEHSLNGFPDKQKRLDLRVSWKRWKRIFSYLNKIKRKDFEQLIAKYEEMWIFKKCTISYFMLKNKNIFSKIPILREIFIRHIVWVIKK